MTSPLSPIVKLEDLFRAEAEKHGARLVNFSVQPSAGTVLVVLELDDELFLDDDGKRVRQEFEQIEQAYKTQERVDQQTKQSLAGLAELHNDLEEE